MSTKGLAAPEAEKTYVRARQLCQTVGDASQSFQVEWGLWLVYQQRGKIDLARSATKSVLQLAEKQKENIGYLLQAHHAAWTTELFIGNILDSRKHTKIGDELYDISRHRRHAFNYGGHDPGVCAKTTSSEADCLLGYVDQAVKQAHESVVLAEQLSHPFSLAMARYFVAQVHQYRREPELVFTHAKSAITLCESNGFESFLAQSKVLQGWSKTIKGEFDAGITQIRDGLDAWQSTGTGMRRPYFLALLADAYLHANKIEEGLKTIDEAEALIEQSNEYRWHAETIRLKGTLLERSGEAVDKVELAYKQALEIAGGQKSRLLQLRAATSLGQLWRDQGRTAEAHKMVGSLLTWFTEGLDTPDLKEATSLLDSES